MIDCLFASPRRVRDGEIDKELRNQREREKKSPRQYKLHTHFKLAKMRTGERERERNAINIHTDKSKQEKGWKVCSVFYLGRYKVSCQNIMATLVFIIIA